MKTSRHFARLFLIVAATTTGAVMFGQSSAVIPSVANGDYNGDGSRNITDAINMFQYLFTDRATPPVPVDADCGTVDPSDGSPITDRLTPSLQNGDVNGDGSFNLADCIYFLNWLFIGGEEPLEIECRK